MTMMFSARINVGVLLLSVRTKSTVAGKGKSGERWKKSRNKDPSEAASKIDQDYKPLTLATWKQHQHETTLGEVID